MNVHTVAIYTIKNGADMVSIDANGGIGWLDEGHRWVAGAEHLQAARDAGEALALLLGDATTTGGVEWIALVDKIEFVGESRTRVQFSFLAPLPQPFPLSGLTKVSDGQPIGEQYIRGYSLCELPAELEPYASQLAYASTEPDPSLHRLARLPASRFVDAVNALKDSWSPTYKAMLLGHARAPKHVLSVAEVAQLGGYQNYETGNLQYGTLAGQFKLALHAEGISQNLQAISYCPLPKNELGHYRFRLRPQLVYALRSAKLIEEDSGTEDASVPDAGLDSATRHAVERQLASDSAFAAADETTKKALVDARIGQGAYRRQLLAIWDGQCALTGLKVKEALVASHAKPWSEATNSERLDPYNGLILAATVDRLFDTGLISFAADGRILVNPKVGAAELSKMGIAIDDRLPCFHERHAVYLAWHRVRNGFDE